MAGIGLVGSQMGIAGQYDSQAASFAANDRRMALAHQATPNSNFGTIHSEETAMELESVRADVLGLAYEQMAKKPHKPSDAGNTFNTFNAIA